MSNELIVSIVLIAISLSLGVIMMLFAYQMMPQTLQKNFNDMQLVSGKALKILSAIVIVGAVVQVLRGFVF